MFRSYRDITRDISKDHPRNTEPKTKPCDLEYYACNYCEDEYLSETEVEIHKRIRHKEIITKLVSNPKKIVCKVCFYECANNDHLLRHLKVEHLFSSEDMQRIEREIFVCDICNQIFFNKQMLAIHIVHNHKESVKRKARIQCPKCNKMVRLATVWYHFQYHEIQSVACCPICLKKCKNRADLKIHLKTHPSHLYCDICGYQANKTQNFKDHIATTHCNNKPKEAIRSDVVKRCFIPKKSTFFKVQSQWGLWRGMKLQDGVYICILCREVVEASDPNKLKEHVGRVHIMDKQEDKKVSYVCTCGESFFNKILLKHHVFKMKGDHKQADEINETTEPQQCAISTDDRDAPTVEVIILEETDNSVDSEFIMME